jgi:branched-chain amino acid transport system ATP-binding protein
MSSMTPLAAPSMTVAAILTATVQAQMGQSELMTRRFPLAECRDRAFEVMAMLGLSDKAMTVSSSLSHDDQKLLDIGLARTLMGNPVALLLDEPSEGLAPIVVQHIVEILHRLRGSGSSILIAEQNMYFCLGVATDATVIDKGQIVYRDTIGGLKANTEIRTKYLAI